MRLSLIPLFALMLSFTGCSYVQSDTPAPLSFKRYQPIILNVGTVEFIDEYKSPGKAPNVEHLLPYSPEEAMRIWVKERIRATGNESTLQVIIKDGSVISTPLATSTGVMTFLGLAQDKRYDLNLVVEMRIYGRGSAISEASIQVSAQRTISITDNTSLHERNVAFQRMIAEAMESINAELEKNMFAYFGNYITYQ